ncbi:putative lipid II flippase FtsW [candidate division KSB1 bacterium]|nr:putative lipid II flippase FtsW [candidate division KSB1 bacterium]
MLIKKNRVDRSFLLVILALVVLGMVMVYSASNVLAEEKFGDSHFFLKRQLIRVAVGLLLLFLAIHIDYRIYQRYAKIILLFSFLLLVATLLLKAGGGGRGTSRWMAIWGLSIQPSEIAKFTLILFFADSLVRNRDRLESFFGGFFPHLVILAIAGFLIIQQPDFSTALLISLVLILMLYVAGVKLSHLIITALVSLPVLYGVIFFAPYRRERLLAFFNSTQGAEAPPYQTAQSLISLGNGGWWGLGLGGSKQKLFFLPEPHTDFIFAIIGEEWGFVGALLVLSAFVFIMVKGVRIVRRAPEEFGFFLALGLLTAISLYAFVNMGVVVGLLPTTGLPLPFLSYGGSSLSLTLGAVGVLLNISQQGDPQGVPIRRKSGKKGSN